MPPPLPPQGPPAGAAPHLLVTAGPTHEPIDGVRYIGNRSSGRLGVALADHAAQRGWRATLLLGPTGLSPTDSRVVVHRFRTTADLDVLLQASFPGDKTNGAAPDVLVMAAAVADYRPKCPADASGKLRRTDRSLTLELEPTPDLLAGCSARRRSGQLVVGFALEPRDRLIESALSKLKRKSLDMIVANPLETMDARTIEATVLTSDGGTHSTGAAIDKGEFARWLLGIIESALPSAVFPGSR